MGTVAIAIVSAFIGGMILLFFEYRTGWFAARVRKELSYEIVAVTSLVALDEEVEKQFRDGEESRVRILVRR